MGNFLSEEELSSSLSKMSATPAVQIIRVYGPVTALGVPAKCSLYQTAKLCKKFLQMLLKPRINNHLPVFREQAEIILPGKPFIKKHNDSFVMLASDASSSVLQTSCHRRKHIPIIPSLAKPFVVIINQALRLQIRLL